MALNVKNRAAEEAVRKLMAVTGEGQAQAIERAARERLDRLLQQDEAAAVTALVQQIQRDFRDAALSTDALYDETGLPR